MKKVALTGGIGTGKTFISRLFIKEGTPVFYADVEAKKLYEREDVVAEMRSLFGEAIFTDGQLDFQKIAQHVFHDESALQQLNALIHPLVMQRFEQWAAQQQADTVIMESAIIYEAHLEHYFDKVIVVNASIPVRIARVKRRNPNMTEEEIMARINQQMDQELKCKLADEVIDHEEDW